ncbi:MAG: hypothetical protein A2177_10755 [Spirochaetes bacterium RBG_13_68_11]|nr:MAG: hypothetical protein A2177_10755 [Spirochaetes bacterium RBG_13_68_11]
MHTLGHAIRRGTVFFALLVASGAVAFAGATIMPNGDLRIPKKEVTTAVKFYQYKSGGVLMEVLALRAPDGSVRTAFNTCQVCYSSGRGYYTQKGDYLVCNNCGNRFLASQVELIKGGCNPVPITKDLKFEDANFITIPRAILDEAKPLFLKWKR